MVAASEAAARRAGRRCTAAAARACRRKPVTTVAKAIAAGLAASGTRLAFTVPGESFLSLLDAFLGAGIRPVATRHEGAAAFMAEAAAAALRPPAGRARDAHGGCRERRASASTRRARTRRPWSRSWAASSGRHKGREAFQESDLVHGIGSLAKRALEPANATEALRQVHREGLKAIATRPAGPAAAGAAGGPPRRRVGGEVTPAPSSSQGPARRPRGRAPGPQVAGGVGAGRHPRGRRRASRARATQAPRGALGGARRCP